MIRLYFVNGIIQNPSSFLAAVEVFVWVVCYSYCRHLVDEKASANLLGVVHYA
jgi:hypothetical protein